MNKQSWKKISASHKNSLVKFAKRNGFRNYVKKSGFRLYDVVIYCSSEALEDRRF